MDNRRDNLKTCTKCGKEKEINLFSKNKSACKSCVNIYYKTYCEKNKEKVQARDKSNYEKNKATIKVRHKAYYYQGCNKERAKAYREANRERILKKEREYRENNKEKRAEVQSRWAKANKDKINMKKSKRRALKLNATPLWATKKAIESIYAFSTFLTKTTFGNGYHVDHIVPLSNASVCGLHCEDNLQVLRAEDNQSKGNRHWPNMWL